VKNYPTDRLWLECTLSVYPDFLPLKYPSKQRQIFTEKLNNLNLCLTTRQLVRYDTIR